MVIAPPWVAGCVMKITDGVGTAVQSCRARMTMRDGEEMRCDFPGWMFWLF